MDNSEASWESLAVIRKDNSVTLANYAHNGRLINQRWRWAHHITKKEKKFIQMIKSKMLTKKNKKKPYRFKYKFGIKVPRIVTPDQYNIQYTVGRLARHMMIPRQGHMHATKRLFRYLRPNYKFAIKFNTEEPDFSMHKLEN